MLKDVDILKFTAIPQREEQMSWYGRIFPPQGWNEKTSHSTPTRSKLSIFRQLCNPIPGHLMPQLARSTGTDKKSRSFTPWSHVVSLLYARLLQHICFRAIRVSGRSLSDWRQNIQSIGPGCFVIVTPGTFLKELLEGMVDARD